jgi:hypothetical protein
VTSPLHGEPEGPVEQRQLVGPEAPGLAFPQTHSRHAHSSFYLVVERDGIAAEMQPSRQRLQAFPGLVFHQFSEIEDDAALQKVFPTGDPLELRADQDSQLLR